MANCVVSTVSALADVIKDEMEYKTIRDLTKKKETLMTQISRVALKLGSKATDYEARRVPLRLESESEPETEPEPEPEPEPECTTIQTLNQSDFPATGIAWGNNNNDTIISCFEIGPGKRGKPEKIVISIGSNSITIYGNLTIRENTTLYIEKGSTVIITGKLTMESNAKLIISDSTFQYQGGEATLNNSIITVSGCSILQSFTLDLQNTQCTIDFQCNVDIDGVVRFENTTKSTIKVGSKEYNPSDTIPGITGVICNKPGNCN